MITNPFLDNHSVKVRGQHNHSGNDPSVESLGKDELILDIGDTCP